jgi:hypothetical protein
MDKEQIHPYVYNDEILFKTKDGSSILKKITTDEINSTKHILINDDDDLDIDVGKYNIISSELDVLNSNMVISDNRVSNTIFLIWNNASIFLKKFEDDNIREFLNCMFSDFNGILF